jgi:hypothetical protein
MLRVHTLAICVVTSILAALGGLGCFTDCTTNVVPAIAADVRSASTGLPLADSALGFAIDGAYSDSLIACGSDSVGRMTTLCGAWERAGIYTVVVTRPGYQRWSQAGISAPRRACHVQTQTVHAAMAPNP